MTNINRFSDHNKRLRDYIFEDSRGVRTFKGFLLLV